MPDMLVKLYDLPDSTELFRRVRESGVTIRRPLGPEKRHVTEWALQHFRPAWQSECDVAFSNTPISCFIAVKEVDGASKLLGFACYDATCRGFFGPTGVDEAYRGGGIGRALLMRCLEAMRDEGYGYAVIGGAGPVDFYAHCCGATVIEGSAPGVYRGMLRYPTGEPTKEE